MNSGERVQRISARKCELAGSPKEKKRPVCSRRIKKVLQYPTPVGISTVATTVYQLAAIRTSLLYFIFRVLFIYFIGPFVLFYFIIGPSFKKILSRIFFQEDDSFKEKQRSIKISFSRRTFLSLKCSGPRTWWHIEIWLTSRKIANAMVRSYFYPPLVWMRFAKLSSLVLLHYLLRESHVTTCQKLMGGGNQRRQTKAHPRASWVNCLKGGTEDIWPDNPG